MQLSCLLVKPELQDNPVRMDLGFILPVPLYDVATLSKRPFSSIHCYLSLGIGYWPPGDR